MKVFLFTAALITISIGYVSCDNAEQKPSAGLVSQDCLTEEQKNILKEDSLLNILWADQDSLLEADMLTNKQDALFAADTSAGRRDPPYYGSIVKHKEVEETKCFKAYEDSMRNHGIDEKKPRAINLQIAWSLQITAAEVFRGKELRKFIRQAAFKRGLLGPGKKLAIRVEFGIYTEKFVEHRDPSRKGRIGIFLVTHKYGEDPKTKKITEEGVDEDAFDFGGIHP